MGRRGGVIWHEDRISGGLLQQRKCLDEFNNALISTRKYTNQLSNSWESRENKMLEDRYDLWIDLVCSTWFAGSSVFIGLCHKRSTGNPKHEKLTIMFFIVVERVNSSLALVGSNNLWVSFWWIRTKLTRKLMHRNMGSSFSWLSCASCKLSRSKHPGRSETHLAVK